jgi:hypothetical protein
MEGQGRALRWGRWGNGGNGNEQGKVEEQGYPHDLILPYGLCRCLTAPNAPRTQVLETN